MNAKSCECRQRKRPKCKKKYDASRMHLSVSAMRVGGGTSPDCMERGREGGRKREESGGSTKRVDPCERRWVRVGEREGCMVCKRCATCVWVSTSVCVCVASGGGGWLVLYLQHPPEEAAPPCPPALFWAYGLLLGLFGLTPMPTLMPCVSFVTSMLPELMFS